MQDIEKQLEDNDIEIRREAVESLRGAQSDVSVRLLLKAMRDNSWRVRKTAVEILLQDYTVDAYIKGLIELLAIDDNAGARNSAIESLIRLGKKATLHLIEAFKTTNHDVRKFIIDVLGEFKDTRSLPLMLDALKDEDDNVRASAVEHLGKIKEPAVVDVLISILEGSDLWTAYPAADALGRIGDKKAIPHLIKALSVKTLREPVLKALARFSEPETLKHIVPLLEYPSKTIHEEALKTINAFYRHGVSAEFIAHEIREFFKERAVDVLVSHAWNTKPEVRIAAIFLLGIMEDERALTPLLELSLEEELADDVKRALVFIGKGRPEIILPLFETESLYQKRFICGVAAELASKIFYKKFEKLIADDDGHVRTLAVHGISKLGDVRAVPLIKSLLSDVYEDVQEAAVAGLAALRSGINIKEFIHAVNYRDPIVKKNAVLVLGKIGAVEAVSAVGFALKNDDINVRLAAVKALSMIKSEESVKYLLLAFTDENPDVRATAALSLSSVKGRKDIIESLILLLSDAADSVRVSAIKALGELADKEAIANLVRLLSDTNGLVVASAIESLGRIDGEAARDALLKMLDTEDREIRRTAIRALAPFSSIEENLLLFLNDKDWATRIAAVEVLGTRQMSSKVRNEFEKMLDTEENVVVKKAIEERLNA